MLLRSALHFVLMWTLAVTGCQAQREQIRSHSVLMSTEAEEEVGEEAAEAVEQKLGFISNEDIIEYVEEIGRDLAALSPRREVHYRFHVVEMIEPNAFALPGGHIYVSRGLLALANSEGEVANVLAHEVAHVALRHHAYRELEARKAKWMGMLAVLVGAIAGGAQGAMAAANGWMVAGQGMLAAYTRDQEREADWLGQELTRKAGWDPRTMASFLRDLDHHTRLRRGRSRRPGYFDTHPGSIERVAKASVRYEHLGVQAGPAGTVAGRARYLEQVEGLVVGQNPEEGVFIENRFVHPGMDFSLRFPDGWRTVNEHSAVRAVEPRGKSMVVLDLQGSGDDPEKAAQEYAEEVEVELKEGQSRRINGRPAYRARTVLDLEGTKVKAEITWIAHEDLIFRIMGVTRVGMLESRPIFWRVARSFRPLAPTERDGMRIVRLRVAELGAEETLQALCERTQNHWTRDETAVYNGFTVGDDLPGGIPVKVAIPEAWEPDR